MRRSIAASMLLAVLMTVAPTSSQAAGDFLVVTVNSATFLPGGDDRGEPLVVPQGARLWYQNLHVSAQHDVAHFVPQGKDRLFGSETMAAWNAGKGIEPVRVNGVESLPPGTYPFFCSHHPAMRGTLMVI